MYHYEDMKLTLFTEKGTVLFTAIRDKTRELLSKAGAARAQEMMHTNLGGDSWVMLACLDRLVELREVREITVQSEVAGQHRVFVST